MVSIKTEIMKTAVEYLIDWMGKNQYFIGNDLLQAVEKAKEMEKEQMCKFAFDFYYDFSNQLGVPFNLISENRLNAEEYYNETFKSE